MKESERESVEDKAMKFFGLFVIINWIFLLETCLSHRFGYSVSEQKMWKRKHKVNNEAFMSHLISTYKMKLDIKCPKCDMLWRAKGH